MEEAEMNKSLLCKLHPEKIHTEVLPWLYLCLALLGFLTNGLVLLDLWKAEKKPMVIFTVNMVVSDIILCCSFLFRFAYLRLYLEWKSGSPICTLSQYGIIGIFYINIYCNMCFLLWTSLNRYATVVQPHNVLLQVFKQPRFCHLICITTWLIFTLAVFGNVFYSQMNTKAIQGSCFDQVYNKKTTYKSSHILGIIIFFLNLALMSTSYGLLVYHLQRIHRTSLVRAWLGPGGGLRVRRKIMASVVLFITCFLPYHIQRTIIIQSDPGDCVKQQRNSYTHSITVLVAALNSCLNPTLYLIIRSTFCRKKRPVTHVTADNSRCNQDPGKHDITAPETI
ncbi:probable G-protein coupled receptor 82 isoform X2 [Denticeps clupeoides]|uniref:probable G-protein coupled receptor 82 isoform X2 n=1 Tax=Denticeps clupeoides TaxID=299321 RepID=UPI0010A3FDB3|nr:probable G-protein coupled receptor 82 isoform X2 [Denticeps clupeoides]